MVQQGHENAASMLARLSSILRYILYESSKDTVSLSKELETIESYIHLQLMRKPKSSNVDFYVEGNPHNFEIAPLILLNFVENCFKHSNIDTSEDGWIRINCTIYEHGQIVFQTENSRNQVSIENNKGGIGNQNIFRQLALRYDRKHSIEIEDEPEFYKVYIEFQVD